MTRSSKSGDVLYNPVTLGGLHLCNRWAMAPLVTMFPETADRPTRNHIEFYGKRASARPGLVIVGAAYVSSEGKGFPNQMGIDSDDKIPAFRELAMRIQQFTPAILQLFHAGPKTSRNVSGQDVVAPAATAPRRIRYDTSRALTEEEIVVISDRFEASAWRAYQAGFSGVELHGANGYLLHAFSDPRSNFRKDKWGQLDALPILLIRRLRQLLPDRFLIGYTLSPYFVDSGDSADAKSLDRFAQLAGQIAQAGAGYIHVYRGKTENSGGPRAFAGILRERGIELPVIEGAGIRSAAQAEFFIRSGATLVAVGRALLGRPDLLTDPDFEYPAAELADLATSAGIQRAFAAECGRGSEILGDRKDDIQI
jgi:2,4-dienoyl-CoA reductase-like NADH-dependent reductase (Old Yellow Enzyme family)